MDKLAVWRYEVGDFDTRPWGSWRVVDLGDGFAVKRIEVNPGARLSLQLHNHRTEHWVIVTGHGQATVGEDLIDVGPGHHVLIACGAKHRIHNLGETPLVFIEVQYGESLDENDIVRFEDDYGRLA